MAVFALHEEKPWQTTRKEKQGELEDITSRPKLVYFRSQLETFV